MKKLLSSSLFITMLFISTAFSANIEFSPIFSQERFAPNDKLHATCDSNVDVIINSKDQNLKSVYSVLEFNNNDVEILKVFNSELSDNKGKISLYSDKIEYFNPSIKVGKGSKEKLFTIVLRSKKGVYNTNFNVKNQSYALDESDLNMNLSGALQLKFSDVPECNPDMVPPSISLVKPSTNSTGIELDSIFIFEVKDNGKGVDWNSINISIGEKKYDINSKYLSISGDLVYVQPEKWLAVNRNLVVKASVVDKQNFGGANKSEEKWTVKTANEILLQNEVNPMDIKMNSYIDKKIRGNMQECLLLDIFRQNLQDDYGKIMNSVMEKIQCNSEIEKLDDDFNYEGFHASALVKDSSGESISIFALTGRFLLFIMVSLKVYNFLSQSTSSNKNKK